MNTTFRTLFIPKYNKVNKHGEIPIYCRITVDGKRSEFSTGITTEPARWKQSSEKIRGNSELITSKNLTLKKIRDNILSTKFSLENNGQMITSKSIKNKYFGVGQVNKALLEVAQEYSSRLKNLIGNGYSKATWKRFVTTEKHIQDFLNKSLHRDDIFLIQLKYAHIDDFFNYLRSKDDPCSHNTAIKYVKNLKKILNYCVEREYIERNPGASFRVTLEETETVFLTNEELTKIRTKELPVGRLELIRDIFLFCCYTGLAYSDVQKLNEGHITKDIDGGDWIHIERSKTGTKARIFLLPQAKAVLDKYLDCPTPNDQLLPVPSNQKVNAYLKEIATICNINKNLSSHVARHTFATHLLNMGVSMDSVRHQLGQKSIAQTQHYAKLLGKTVSKEMKRYEKKEKRVSEDEKAS